MAEAGDFLVSPAFVVRHFLRLRSCFEMVPVFYHAEFSRQFRLRKRERSSGYVTDDEDENGRKGRVIKERN